MSEATPLSAADALEKYFLEARSKLLDVAAVLDRIDRGGSLGSDPRIEKIQKALATLQRRGPNRAEEVQQIFSRSYDAKWERPKGRG
jgi:hypothetical protein